MHEPPQLPQPCRSHLYRPRHPTRTHAGKGPRWSCHPELVVQMRRASADVCLSIYLGAMEYLYVVMASHNKGEEQTKWVQSHVKAEDKLCLCDSNRSAATRIFLLQLARYRSGSKAVQEGGERAVFLGSSPSLTMHFSHVHVFTLCILLVVVCHVGPRLIVVGKRANAAHRRSSRLLASTVIKGSRCRK